MKTTLSTVVCLMAVGFLPMNQALAQDEPAPTVSPSVVDPAAMKRWQDDRFGMFIHWGPCSLKAAEISWSRGGVRRDRSGTGSIPPEVYDNLYKQFDPEKFNAKQWVNVAKSAGMKYIIIVAKHHDGFCMFDSKLTDYKITNTPFKRDVCAELAQACHDAGIRLGFYYSPPDWHNPDFFTKNHAKYIAYMHGQIRELLTNYGEVDELWFDTDGGTNKPETWDNATLFPMIRQLQPQILINKRCGGWGDFDTPEQRVGGFDRQQPWESCITISAHNHWSWGGDGDGVKPLRTLLETVVDCAGGDGNMLLDVGPQPDGQINAAQVDRLKEVGQWMDKYGDTLYATRGGPYKPGNWGAATCKGNDIYLHIFNWKGDALHLSPLGHKIIKSELLTGGNVNVVQDDHGVTVSVAPSDRQKIDTLVKLELNAPASDLPIGIAASGSIAAGKSAKASNVSAENPECTADKAFDDDTTTFWATDAGTSRAWLEVDLGRPMTIACAEISEGTPISVGFAGPGIQSFELQYLDTDQWKTFFTGKTIGTSLKTFTFPPITARHVRLNILDSKSAPAISEFELFSTP
jgi:alpha-L-fucosidase